MRARYFHLLILAIASSISPALAAGNLIIFDDRFKNGFEDHSWVTRSLTNRSPVHSGVYSIAVSSATNWEGLYFYHTNFDSSPYQSVTFWAHGGKEGGQEIQIQGLLDNKTPSDDTYSRADLTTNWQQVTVSFEDLGVVDKTNFTGFWIQETPDSPDTPFYIDDVQLDAKPAPATPSAVIPTNEPTVKSSAPPAATIQNDNRMVVGIVGALGVIIVLLGSLVFMFWRRGTNHANVARSTTALSVTDETSTPASLEDWKQRALAAEAMAGKQGERLREKIVPELTEFAKQSLVQGLYAQRNTLLETQQKAHQALSELESRLGALQLPLQERIRAYEKRIVELEKEVESQGAEVRELARATLALMRKKLEDEKELGRASGNRFN